MADEILRSKHAFGNLADLDAAIEAGKVDEFDILYLDGATDPKIGWVDKNGNKVIVDTDKIIVCEKLPDSGVAKKIYICGESGYFWDGERFVDFCKPTDLTDLETQVGEIEATMETKVDAETVQSMIEAYSESMMEVVEF